MFMLNLAVINKEVRVSCKLRLQTAVKRRKSFFPFFVMIFWEKRDAICVIRNKEGYLS